MRKHTRLVAAVIATAALVLPTAACSTGPSEGGTESGKIEIDFFHRWPNDPKKTYFDDLVAQFEAENPNIQVNTESVLNDNYKDKIKVVAGSNNAPDVMFTWSGSFIAELAKAGSLFEIDTWLKEDPELAERYYPSQLPPFNVDGTQYGLPLGMHSKVFYYNAEVFEDLGVRPPATWDEFTSLLQKIEQKTGENAIEFGAVDTWTIAHYLGTLNQRVLDPAVFNADMNPAAGEFTDPGYVLALERLAELAEFTNDDALAIDHEVARNAWMTGDAGPLFYAQSAEIGYFDDVAFEYSTFNFPAVAGGKGDPTQLTGAPEGFVISSSTEHPEEAKKFVSFMLNKANGIEYTETTGELSAVQGAVDEAEVSPATKELAQQILDASQMAPWLDNAYDPQIVATYLTETQLMLGGQQTPTGVMEKVQETASRVRNAS